ncbi:unnamed protein product [Amoebophrya sp. A120]|nr:unnamed protein product [Amoebophrya sp. A120]|eukprot:GSA120T00024414001.1
MTRELFLLQNARPSRRTSRAVAVVLRIAHLPASSKSARCGIIYICPAMQSGTLVPPASCATPLEQKRGRGYPFRQGCRDQLGGTFSQRRVLFLQQRGSHDAAQDRACSKTFPLGDGFVLQDRMKEKSRLPYATRAGEEGRAEPFPFAFGAAPRRLGFSCKQMRKARYPFQSAGRSNHLLGYIKRRGKRRRVPPRQLRRRGRPALTAGLALCLYKLRAPRMSAVRAQHFRRLPFLGAPLAPGPPRTDCGACPLCISLPPGD